MKSKNPLAKPKKPDYILADHEIPGLGGLRSLHIDPTKITREEVKLDPIAKKALEISAIFQILLELSDVNQTGPHADRWDQEKYFQRKEEDGRSPFLKFSTAEKLIEGIDATYPQYIESIGIKGYFRYGAETFNTDVVYDFANRQPTKVLASIIAGQDTNKSKRAVAKITDSIMPRRKFYLSSVSIEPIDRLGDYEERRKAIEAVVLKGYVKYGGSGKPMYAAWMDLIKRAENSKIFTPRDFYLRVNESFEHHQIKRNS